ncbi:MAG: hypothetical protein WCP60_06610 [bacterium]
MKTNPTQPPASSGATLSPTRLLADRLKKLGVNSSGLPSTVVEDLKAQVDAEFVQSKQALARQIKALQQKAEQQLQQQVSRLITYKKIAKAFEQVQTKLPSGGAGK